MPKYLSWDDFATKWVLFYKSGNKQNDGECSNGLPSLNEIMVGMIDWFIVVIKPVLDTKSFTE